MWVLNNSVFFCLFNAEDLDAAVAYDKDIKEVLAEDPRLYVDITSSSPYLTSNGANSAETCLIESKEKGNRLVG